MDQELTMIHLEASASVPLGSRSVNSLRTQELLCHGLNAKPQMPLHMAACNIQACYLEWGTRKREGRRERKLQYKWRSGNYTPKFWGLSNGTAAAAAKLHQSCLTLCDPIGALQAPPFLGFSRQEHLGGLPFPSPMHKSEKWKRSRTVLPDSQRHHGLQPIRLLHPWHFPGKSTGEGHQCLLCQMVTTTVYNTSAVSQKDKPTVFSQSPNSPPTSIPKNIWIFTCLYTSTQSTTVQKSPKVKTLMSINRWKPNVLVPEWNIILQWKCPQIDI